MQVYLRLVGFAAGTLLHLFLVVLIAGYRRPRNFERVFFFLALSLFLFYAGVLLALNAEVYYSSPPVGTLAFAVVLIALGLGFLPPLLVHLHVAYYRTLSPAVRGWWPATLLILAYLPVGYFALYQFARLLEGSPLAFLRPGSRVGVPYGVWLAAAMLVGLAFQLTFARQAPDARQRRLHWALLVFFGLGAGLVFCTYALGGPRDPGASAALTTGVMLSSLLPSSLLGYFILRYNFLEIGGQRNLVYAVSAAFLALLYLSVVRRIETWLEPALPPDATAAILLFVLVVFFEPLQRWMGRALHRTFRSEVDRLQRLTTEIQQEARHGDLGRLAAFAENCIREEFGLAEVRLSVANAARPPAPASEQSGPRAMITPERSGRRNHFALLAGKQEIGALEARAFGSAISGETHAALGFLAEQLPAMLDLCRLLEEKLALERELAERERLALVGQMAASISHNLKNPLGSMKTVLQVQLENPDLPEGLRADCRMVVEEIDRLGAKLGQLLRYAKPSLRAGGALQRVASVALAEQVVALLSREAERRQIKLELERPASEIYVRGSEEALSDVLSNLVVNAIEALPERGSARVRLSLASSKLLLEVSDDGPGIPPEHRARIFQPFFTTKPSGTGLGLAIVERRVREMGGEISWESPNASGRGTRFVITAPLADERA